MYVNLIVPFHWCGYLVGGGVGGVVYYASAVAPPLRDVRLGRNGATEVKAHLFFKQDDWTWTNIRQCVAPVTPELKSDEDTQYFDEIEEDREKLDGFPKSKVFLDLPSPLPSSSLLLLPYPNLYSWCGLGLGATA